MAHFDTIVYAGCAWSGYQQTLARERDHIGFLLVESRGSNFEHGLRHVPGCSELNFTCNGTCVGCRVMRSAHVSSLSLVLVSAPKRN